MGQVLENGHEAAKREAEVLERLWGWRSCGRCGETIILGEETPHLRCDGSIEKLCLGCAATPRRPHAETSGMALGDCPPVETRESRDAA